MLRLLLALPCHTLLVEPDAAVGGLTAFEVLRGDLPVFNVGYRNGALESYLIAALFWLIGPSRVTLALAPAIFGVATLVVWYLFFRATLDRRTAIVALSILTIPASQFLYWTSLPNTYPATMFLSAAILWLGTLAAARPRDAVRDFGLGLAVGLGWWSSPLSLSCSIPVYAWLSLRDPGRWLRLRQILAGVVGMLLGALPWIAFNLRYDFPSLRRSFATRPLDGMADLVESGVRLLTFKVPALLANTDPRVRPSVFERVEWLVMPILALHLAAALVVVWLVWRSRRGDDAMPVRFRQDVVWLWLMVAATITLLNLVSSAGLMPGPTARYLLPLYLVVPGVLAVFLRWLAARSRWAAGVALGVLLVFNLLGTHQPWTEERRAREATAESDDRLVQWLGEQGVRAVIGDYFAVYSINFHSRLEVLGLPLLAQHDHKKVIRRLEDRPTRFALIASRNEVRRFRRWLRRSGLEGELFEWGRFTVFLVSEPRLGPDFVRRVREDTGGRY